MHAISKTTQEYLENLNESSSIKDQQTNRDQNNTNTSEATPSIYDIPCKCIDWYQIVKINIKANKYSDTKYQKSKIIVNDESN